MAVPDLLAGEIREDRLAAGYVFFGVEDYLAEDFIMKLRRALIPPEAQALGLESFDLSQIRWPEIIDTARTTPFFFSSWRIVVARACEEGKPEREAKANRLVYKIIEGWSEVPNLPMIEVPVTECNLDTRVCQKLMKSKYRLPAMYESKFGGLIKQVLALNLATEYTNIYTPKQWVAAF